jgi:tripartite-type tricarboxylate transporter receptor subunit TctC
MQPPRRRFLRLAAGAAVLPAVSRIAQAQAFPSRPLTMIVPFAAGGPADTVGRIIAEGMRASLGQSVIVENVAGASGSIGVGRLARAAPDGYTFGHGGMPTHVAGVFFQQVSGTRFALVPYRGAGPAMQDLVAGQIDMMIDPASNTLPQVRAGRIKAYAVTEKNRLSAAPEIPTVDEAGLPGFHILNWQGFFAPKGTPTAVVARLNAVIAEALADPAVRARLADLGQEIFPRDQQTPEALAARQKAEMEKWWPIIKAAGIKGE